PLIDIFDILSRGNTQPLLQTIDDGGLIALIPNELARTDQSLEGSLHRIRRAVNKTPTRNHAGSLLRHVNFRQLRQAPAPAAGSRAAKSVSQHGSIHCACHHSLRPYGIIPDDANLDFVSFRTQAPMVQRHLRHHPYAAADALNSQDLTL